MSKRLRVLTGICLLLMACLSLYLIILRGKEPPSSISAKGLIKSGESLLAYEKFDLNRDGKDDLVLKLLREQSVVLVLFFSVQDNFQKVWESQQLGSGEAKFWLEGEKTSLEISDINRDGLVEVLTAAFDEPSHKFLYVYVWDGSSQTLMPVLCSDGPNLLTSAFFVSDVGWTVGTDLVVEKNGIIRVVGKDYYLDSPPRIAEYQYKWDGQKYVFRGIKDLGPLWPKAK